MKATSQIAITDALRHGAGHFGKTHAQTWVLLNESYLSMASTGTNPHLANSIRSVSRIYKWRSRLPT